jgi:hypothetical protein
VLGEGKLRRGSLLGLAALARSPAEERRFRAAAYLYDPEHDAALLAGSGDAKLARTPTVTEPLAELLGALRLIRQSRGPQAKAIIERPVLHDPIAGLAKIITPDELLAACLTKNLSDEQFLQVLQAESAIERSLSGRAAGGADSIAPQQAGWTAAVKSHGLTPLPSLALDSLTEFDPQACLYRDGKWIAP